MSQEDEKRIATNLPTEQTIKNGVNGSEDEDAIESVPLYRNLKIVIPLFIVVLGISFAMWQYYINARDFITTDDAYIDGNRVSISAKMLGRIDRLNVDEADTVQEGEILVKLDDSDLRAQEEQAKAALALSEENITLAEVSLDRAQTDFERASAQFKENIIPKEQYDHSKSEYESAKARSSIA